LAVPVSDRITLMSLAETPEPLEKCGSGSVVVGLNSSMRGSLERDVSRHLSRTTSSRTAWSCSPLRAAEMRGVAAPARRSAFGALGAKKGDPWIEKQTSDAC